MLGTGQKLKAFFKKRLIEPLLFFLSQGISPPKLALATTAGILVSTFPVFGSHSIICAGLIILLRLNGPLVLLVNNLSYPLIFVSYIPLMKAGALLFNQSANQISLSYVFKLFEQGVWQAIQTLWTVTWHAILAWLLLLVLVFPLIYFLFLLIFKFVLKNKTGGIRTDQ